MVFLQLYPGAAVALSENSPQFHLHPCRECLLNLQRSKTPVLSTPPFSMQGNWLFPMSICAVWALLLPGDAEQNVQMLPAAVQPAGFPSACWSAAEMLFKKHVDDKRAIRICSFAPTSDNSSSFLWFALCPYKRKQSWNAWKLHYTKGYLTKVIYGYYLKTSELGFRNENSQFYSDLKVRIKKTIRIYLFRKKVLKKKIMHDRVVCKWTFLLGLKILVFLVC